MVKSEHNIQTRPNKAMPSPTSVMMKKKYKGVRMRSWGSWVSEIRAPNQKTRIWLGSYSTPEAAARAYDAALLCLKGKSVNLNFPTSSYHHHPDTTLSPKSIQRVAAAAANSFIDTTTTTTTTPPPSTSSSTTTTTSSSFSTSSPSESYSPSNHIEDDFSLVSSLDGYKPCGIDEVSMSLATPWCNFNFDSPKYNDMLNGAAFFDPTMIEDSCEEGDIRLWSFC